MVLPTTKEQDMAQDHSFKVSNGLKSYETDSWKDACDYQYTHNRMEAHYGREPIWKIWIFDVDGVGCTVNTQVPGIR
ncbi:hypothetical protein PBI_MIMI_20 [Arthrobacter phage Mimi]|nr:hypothetical protein PBI_MIMI_99 [Arthrobacter phage Mimi]